MACSFPTNQAIVVGGGLGGMSAANTVVEHGGRVVLLDKSSFCGGNSTKATSGINGAGTKTQKAKGIPDTAEIFTQDTLKGGAKKPELAKLLCVNSAADVDWLVEKFNLDLSLVARLGGHSQPRTHRGKERFPGMTITYALIQMLEKVAEKTDLARIITKAKVFQLVTDKNACVGCIYEKGGLHLQEFGPVILASGGFGADFTQDSLLAKYRPDLLHLPTTNGEHCTGDGIKMGEAIGAKTIDLEWVQVHPTGLVKPDDADAKIKFLAAEALRGVGGIILNAEGNRFCNELGRRDYVTGEMWKSKPPFRLCLNRAASDEIIWHCKHYTGRGVMKYYNSGDDLAKDMGIPLSVIEKAHEDHYQAAKMMEKDPEGGKWPAYPSGKCWDEASGKTGSGKKFYHNIIPGSAVKSEPFYVAIITPVIHYCMGGLLIDTDSACVGSNNLAVPGLYAAGEVAGGVHGNNRLGGNSLLDCVVFGRVAGKAAAKYMLGADMKDVDLMQITGGGLSGAVQSSKLAGGSYEDKMNSAAPAAAAAAPAAGGGGGGGISLADVAKHNTKTDCWVVVDGQVLDVTSFLSEHPGGELAILTFAGKDATEEFNMIHPPDVIGKYAPDSVIGMIGAGGGGGGGAVAAAGGGGGGGGITMEEVGKHNSKTDCWVVVDGQVLDVTSFLSEHPGGELAILTFAGKDATEEFNMIHPPDVIGKYAPDSIIGKVGSGAPAPAAEAATGGGLGAPLLDKSGQKAKDWSRHEKNRELRMKGEGRIPGWIGAVFYMVLGFMKEILFTIVPQSNVTITGDRVGLTRSAMFLFIFIIIHAVGNLHVFLGPDDFNGYGYFYVRLYWTGFGFQANIVEEYILLAALLHVFVALKRTWDISMNYSVASGKLNLAFSGVTLLTFMMIHLYQFRFGDTEPWKLCPPPYLLNLATLLQLRLNLFWVDTPGCQAVYVRDIYRMEFEIFQSLGWVLFYLAAVIIFSTHMCLGWQKVVPAPALEIPKKYHSRAIHMGYVFTFFIALIYASFPLYTHLFAMSSGSLSQEPAQP
ncbi:osm1 [Symbiodinium sp. CCMP2592]|nr:osm1 [Symbiodinium sp. CCMP2592]